MEGGGSAGGSRATRSGRTLTQRRTRGVRPLTRLDVTLRSAVPCRRRPRGQARSKSPTFADWRPISQSLVGTGQWHIHCKPSFPEHSQVLRLAVPGRENRLMESLTHRWMTAVVRALIAPSLAIVATLAQAGGPAAHGPELVVADATAPPAMLDPFKVYGTQAQSFFRLIFEPLFDRDPDGKIRTPLLERWGPVDRLTWEFRLRPGVRFHDGGELTVGGRRVLPRAESWIRRSTRRGGTSSASSTRSSRSTRSRCASRPSAPMRCSPRGCPSSA